MPDPIIQEFTQAYNSANEKIHKGDREGALADYKEMISLFEEINNSDRESIHKEIAASCLEKVYNQLQAAPETQGLSNKTMGVLVGASIIVLVLGLVLILKPSVVGLATIECQPLWNGPEEIYIQKGSAETIDVQEFSSCHLKGVLATQTKNVRVLARGTSVTLRAFNTGYDEITLILISKSNDVLRVPISVNIVGFKT